MGKHKHTHKIGTRLKHWYFDGAIVTIVEHLEDGRYRIDRGHCKTRVSEKTLAREYSTDLNKSKRA